MATEHEHRRQAEHNLKFLGAIDVELFPDWAATIVFYTAVHLAEMLFKKQGGSSGSHRKRNQSLRRRYPHVWRHYQPLYAFSRLSRYWCMKVAAEHVPYLTRRLRRLQTEIDHEMRK